MSFNKSQLQIVGAFLVILSLSLFISGLTLDAITSEAHKQWGAYGYQIYVAPDDELPPNPYHQEGEYYYVEGYWDKPRKTRDEINALAKALYEGQDISEEDLPEENPIPDETTTSNEEEPLIVPTCKVHFTVLKKTIIHGLVDSKQYEPISDAYVLIFKAGDTSYKIFDSKRTNDKGVAVFSLPTGTYDYAVMSTGHQKRGEDNSWTREGKIYYKKIILIVEEIEDNTVVDTTPTDPETPPLDEETLETDDPEIKETVEEESVVVSDLPEDESAQTEWKPHWVKGGGDEQLEEPFDEYFTAGVNRVLLAMGIIGATGILMLFFASLSFKRG